MHGLDPLSELAENLSLVRHVQFADAPGRHEPGTGSNRLRTRSGRCSTTRVMRGSSQPNIASSGDTRSSFGWLDAWRAELVRRAIRDKGSMRSRPFDDVHPGRSRDRDRGRLCLQQRVPRRRRAVLRADVAAAGRFPAPDQDDHRAAGVFDAGGRHRARWATSRTVGRIGGKALGWFIFASLVSLTLGLVLVGTARAWQGDAPADSGGRRRARASTSERPVARRASSRTLIPDQRRRCDERATRSCRSSCSRCSSASAHGGARRARRSTVVELLDVVSHVDAARSPAT